MNSDLKEIYYSLPKAREEIQRRWNDKKLIETVNHYLKKDIPTFFANGPKAILARNINTPNLEFLNFISRSQEFNLDPLCLEYTEDVFTSNNIDKYYLGKICIAGKRSCTKIIDFSKWEHKKINDIRTTWDEDLVNFHHDILKQLYPALNNSHYDMSEWIKRNGSKPEKFYPIFLAFFICHGILFEDFMTTDDEKKFAERVVIPSVMQLQSLFGLKPLIVNLKVEDSCHYPAEVYDLLKLS